MKNGQVDRELVFPSPGFKRELMLDGVPVYLVIKLLAGPPELAPPGNDCLAYVFWFSF